MLALQKYGIVPLTCFKTIVTNEWMSPGANIIKLFSSPQTHCIKIKWNVCHVNA
jgi:hypothetical protein